MAWIVASDRASVPRTTKEGLVKEWIREKIVSGRLVPGHQIGPSAVVARTGWSRTPVREALSGLVGEGWLERSAEGGLTVAGAVPGKRDEAWRLRELLEADIAARAVASGNRAGLVLLEGINEQLRACVADGDRVGARLANIRFHTTLWESARSPLPVTILSGLLAQMPWGAPTNGLIDDCGQEYADDHDGIIAAARRGDAPRVAELVRRHIGRGRAVLTPPRPALRTALLVAHCGRQRSPDAVRT